MTLKVWSKWALTHSVLCKGVNMKIEFLDVNENLNLDNIQGLNFAKYALTVAVAGRHNIVLSGGVGNGKTRLAQCVQNLLPKLTTDEKNSVDAIYALCGLKNKDNLRPFRQPYQTMGIEAMFGGGVNLSPGEVSLAHNGVLFLDKVNEFRTSVLQMLRVPIENRNIILARKGRSVIFPADFQLVMTSNSCPCGNFGTKDKVCLCSQKAVEMYWKKISLPLFDRIELKIDTNNLIDFTNYSLEELRAKIKKAWEVQFARQGKLNGRLEDEKIFNEVNAMNCNAKQILNSEKDFLSVRGLKNILSVARTIADMEEHESIEATDLQVAITMNRGLNYISIVNCGI